MSSVIERLRKRRYYPVQIGAETVHVRALTIPEIKAAAEIDATDPLAAVGYMIGCAVVDESGGPAVPKNDGESNIDYGNRVLTTLDLPQDTLMELQAGIEKAGKVPAAKAIEKNLNPTT